MAGFTVTRKQRLVGTIVVSLAFFIGELVSKSNLAEVPPAQRFLAISDMG